MLIGLKVHLLWRKMPPCKTATRPSTSKLAVDNMEHMQYISPLLQTMLWVGLIAGVDFVFTGLLTRS